MNTPATLLCDFYKLSHRVQYPDNTEMIYATWTPRSNKYFQRSDSVVAFGFQAFIKKYLIEYFNDNFFNKEVDEVVNEYTRIVKNCLGDPSPESKHISDLHDLGYLPIEICAVPEGISVPMKTPMLTIKNTHKDFFWVTNYLETIMSCELWQTSTSATISKEYKKILDKYSIKTTGSSDFVKFQGHDFSMRGMSGLESSKSSGAGHLLSFVGTDSIPSILMLEEYYNADVENELVGTSIPATEHSVMCCGGDGEGELKTYRRLIEDVYPDGMVSIVSDTWDLWNTITNILPKIKESIMKRDGKIIVRPDSGNPVDIICGFKRPEALYRNPRDVKRYRASEEECKGVVELLWDIFGGTINKEGYKELDSHIGCIYGDAITLDRCEEICEKLMMKGFASTNMVFGIGSYSFQYNTRDTFGFALKSTMCIIDGEVKFIYKDPITDDGTKKSQTGGVAVFEKNGEYKFVDKLTNPHKYKGNIMRPIFKDGELLIDDTLEEIRKRAK